MKSPLVQASDSPSSRMCEITPAVLVGGLGTRLRSLALGVPKPLAPVAGRPFVTFVLDQLRRASFDEIVLLTGYRGSDLSDLFGLSYNGLSLKYSQEPEPLGTGGALRHALPLIHSDDVLLLNGDSFCDADVYELYKLHHTSDADLTLTLAWQPDVSRYGRVETTNSGRVASFLEKQSSGESGWINAGVYLIKKQLIEEITPGQFVSLENDLLPGWIKNRFVFAYRSNGAFLDIGTPESYADAEGFVCQLKINSYRTE